jgi:hypothetical protein
MARMTKTQIDYLRKKLATKVEELKANIKSSMIDYTMKDLVKDASEKKFIEWLKENATRQQMVACIDKDGIAYKNPAEHKSRLVSKNGHQYYVTDVLITIEAINSGNYNATHHAFFARIKLLSRLAALEKAQEKIDAKIASLEAEAEAVLDKAVFAGSSEEVQKAIDAFLKRKS